MKEIIDALREMRIKVTIYDNGTDLVDFVLAVAVEEPIDIWYAALTVGRSAIRPEQDGRFLYFPELKIDAATYEYILNQC